MKKILVACFIAMSGIVGTAAPSFADSITITTGDGGYYPRHHRHYFRPVYDPYRPVYRPAYDPYRPAYRHRRPWQPSHVCRVKTVKYFNHGRWMTKTTRVCR